MANNTLSNVRIAHKNDTKANWTSKNPVLLKGEIGIEFDPSASDNSYIVKFKIGDGTNHWADLDYFGGEVVLPAPDGTSIVADNNVWSIAGFSESAKDSFPIKRITSGVSSIEWVSLPSNFSNIDSMYQKLSDIEPGAQVNKVNSVNTKTGNVVLTPVDIGAEPTITKKSAFNVDFETDVTKLKANGTANLGTLSTVAKADHVHPTDTTRASVDALNTHANNKENPHDVTADQAGAVSYDTAGEGQGLSDSQKARARLNIGAGTSSFSGSYDDLTNTPTLGTAAAKNVPSSGNASATQVVMGNDTRLTDSRPASDVYAWAKNATKPSYNASEVGAIPTTQKGAASGVATLDANGLVPTSQLPSFVDDVLEGTAQGVTETSTGTKTATGFILKGQSSACTPEEGKLYIDSVGTNATNIVYRWTGTLFASIGVNLVLGETAETAYRGDRGKIAYDHSQSAHAPSNAEANVINAIKVGGTAATITSKTAEIPIATTSKAGVVKSSTSNNTVSVNSSSGVMTVNNITTDKLVAGANTLILDCGNATI